MARFPRTEPKIAELASVIAQGLEGASDQFPNPPVSATELRAQLDAFQETLVALNAAEAEARQRRVAKRQALKKLMGSMKADLRYAEVVARKEPKKLGLLGWGPRRPRRPLERPGEVRNFRITSEGEKSIAFAWKAPASGGPAAAYAMQRRAGSGGWEAVATVMGTKHTLYDQPRGVELSYRAVAINKAGTGNPSATVRAVL